MDWAEELTANVDVALVSDDFDSALDALQNIALHAHTVSREKHILNFGDPLLDQLCKRIGAQFLESHRFRGSQRSTQTSSPALDVYIASEVYAHGGHTPLIGDLVMASGRESALLVTNLYNKDFDLKNLRRRTGLAESCIQICNAAHPSDRLAWLIENLSTRSPERVFLLNHPQDSVAVAAIQPGIAQRFFLVHINDRNPALGTFHPDATHIDLSPFCYHTCRHWLGIDENIFLPLTAPDLGVRPPFLDDTQPFTTASSGSENKFPRSYAIPYTHVISRMLAETNGRHVHIGKLPRPYLLEFRAALKAKGVTSDRLVYIPHVPSLWEAMVDNRIDLYIGSFPIGGARASVEVMGSGTPAVWHVQSEVSHFQDTHMSYPGARQWTTAMDLIQIVRSADCEWKNLQRKAARTQYDTEHAPDIVKNYIGGELGAGHGHSRPEVKLGELNHESFATCLDKW